MKRCSSCGRRLPKKRFAISNTTKDGRQGYCKKCFLKYRQLHKKNIGIVYILESKGLYKIGFTLGDIYKRIRQLQIGNPFKIKIIKFYYVSNPYNFEKILHSFLYKNSIGGEWFNLKDKQFKLITKLFKMYKDNGRYNRN